MSNEIIAPITLIENTISAPVTLGIIGSGGASTWASITGKPITVATGKNITVSNTMTLAGTDGSTLNIGAGGALGSAAFTEASNYVTLTGAQTITGDKTFTGAITAPRITGKCEGLEMLCKAGLSISAGQVVYVTGASGNNIVIGLAQANAEATSSKTIGISESTLANNATGYVITEGLMTVNISAPTAAEGDPIWLSPTTAGSMVFGVANKPSAPNHIVYLGVVTRKTGNDVVEISVKVQNGSELDELADVSITSPITGHVLIRGAAFWENRSLTSSDLNLDRLTLSGNVSSAAWTTSGLRIKGVAATLTDTTSSGTVAAAYTDAFGGNTIAATSTTTFTNYLTAFFREPTAGTNVTFTNKYALGAESLRVGTSGFFTVSIAGAVGIPTATIYSNGAASTPPLNIVGAWLTSAGAGSAGIAQCLISNGGTWSGSPSGTGLGLRAPSGFTGNFIDAQDGSGASKFSVSSTGLVTLATALPVSSGGTGGTDISTARSNLGLATTQAVTFGSIQNTPIGATTASTGAFTTVSALAFNVSAGSGNPTSGISWNSSNHLVIRHNAVDRMVILSTGATIASDAMWGFSSSTSPSNTTRDTAISRKTSTPGTIRVGNGTANDASGNMELTNITASGNLIASPTTQSGAGALSVAASSIALTTTGVANALTLANGTNGQLLTICHVSRGGGTGTAVLTPTTTNGYTTITFTATGDSVTLQYHTTGGWHIVGSRGVTIA